MAPPIKTFTKDPNAILNYVIDWSAWLGTDAISASSWFVPEGLTQPRVATHTTTEATVWLAGGVVGIDYIVTNRITTIGGLVDDRSVQITIEEA